MRIQLQISSVVSTTAAYAVLAGCSVGGSQTTPLTAGGIARNTIMQQATTAGPRRAVTTTFIRPDAVGQPLLFVSNWLTSTVYIYLQAGKNQQPVGQITGLSNPRGVATDVAGRLYVTESYGPPTEAAAVLIFAPPYTKAPTVLPDSEEDPLDVAVSPRGVVAVANGCNSACVAGTGSVTFYPKNSRQPCATIADPGYYVLSDGFDRKGNLYIRTHQPYSTAVISEITGGCKATAITPLTTSNRIDPNFTNGIKVDKGGRIAILNTASTYTDVIDTYNPPVNGSLGRPVSITPVRTDAYPQNFAFLASGKYFYTAEVQFGGLANEYRYSVGPGSGVPVNSITVGEAPADVALTPPLIP